MILTAQQIQQTFDLVKRHVPYYDLQVEMVDHLASSIEEEIEANSSFSFEQALESAYARFGSSGFKLLVRKRRKSLIKHKWKMWFQSLVSQVTTRQLGFTLATFMIAAFAASFWEKELNEAIVQLILISYIVISLSAEFITGTKTNHKLLLTETFRASIFGFVFPQMLFWFTVKPFLDSAFELGFAIAITGFFLMCKATLSVNKTLLQKARLLYPEAFVKS